MSDLSRRHLLKSALTGGIAALLPSGATVRAVVAMEAADEDHGATAPPAHPTGQHKESAPAYTFFHAEEAAFIEAAVARLIPHDARLPGALEAGVPTYIDRLCGSAWGNGEQFYRSGPWQKGTEAQGYQLPLTPAELYRTALAAISAEHAAASVSFAQLPAEAQDAYLHALKAGKDKDLGGVPGSVFFGQLWDNTIEGYFGDPSYGGNRDMASWRALGFPGAYASYYDVVDQHQIVIDRAPMSIQEGESPEAHGGMHMH